MKRECVHSYGQLQSCADACRGVIAALYDYDDGESYDDGERRCDFADTGLKPIKMCHSTDAAVAVAI